SKRLKCAARKYAMPTATASPLEPIHRAVETPSTDFCSISRAPSSLVSITTELCEFVACEGAAEHPEGIECRRRRRWIISQCNIGGLESQLRGHTRERSVTPLISGCA